MGIKSWLSKIYADRVARKTYRDAANAVANQERILHYLVEEATGTQFGIDHHFQKIRSREKFCTNIPVRDYEALKPYVEKVVAGETDVLWPGKPIYLSKTSGTTSGAKYIPITKESMPEHIKAARNALLMYIHHSRNTGFVNGKMIFLQGSPVLDMSKQIPTGRLSGIVAHHVPKYLQRNRMPTYETNCIEDWETKVETIADETIKEKMTLISGIPAWVQMYFEKLLQKTGKNTVSEVFPHFSLMVYGGVNFQPYAKKFRQLIGKDIDSVELFPASEGFIAYQDRQDDNGMLLNTNAGMYFEFVPQEGWNEEHPKTLSLDEVSLNTNYALLISSNAGLWRYNIGDLVRFTSLNPPRVRVSGRTKHFTSAFGEHVIAEEIEQALTETLREVPAVVNEFTLAPQTEPQEGLPHHEWFIEFEQQPTDWDAFILCLDNKLQEKNPYYRDLIEGKVLKPLTIQIIQTNGFNRFMEANGKLGGQNKVPRLSNTRDIASQLMRWSEKSVSLSKKNDSR